MIEAVKYRPEHLLALALQPSQQWLGKYATRANAEALERCGNAIAVTDGDKVLAVAGVETYWEGRGMAWAFLAGEVKRDFVAGHRIAKRFLGSFINMRIEAFVECDFAAGHRWLKLLGFEVETPVARKYQNGRDCSVYVRFV
jgi:hypothetical protein